MILDAVILILNDWSSWITFFFFSHFITMKFNSIEKSMTLEGQIS